MEVKEIEEFLLGTRFRNLFINIYKDIVVAYLIPMDKFESKFTSTLGSMILGFNLAVNLEVISVPGVNPFDDPANTLLKKEWGKLCDKDSYLGEVLSKLFSLEIRSNKAFSFGYPCIEIEILENQDLKALNIRPYNYILNSNFRKALFNIRDIITTLTPDHVYERKGN